MEKKERYKFKVGQRVILKPFSNDYDDHNNPRGIMWNPKMKDECNKPTYILGLRYDPGTYSVRNNTSIKPNERLWTWVEHYIEPCPPNISDINRFIDLLNNVIKVEKYGI